MPTARGDSPDALLNAAYRDLDLAQGTLLSAASSPKQADSAAESAWLEKGEWLALAKKIGAEKVFFVRDNPVLVIAQQDAGWRLGGGCFVMLGAWRGQCAFPGH